MRTLLPTYLFMGLCTHDLLKQKVTLSEGKKLLRLTLSELATDCKCPHMPPSKIGSFYAMMNEYMALIAYLGLLYRACAFCLQCTQVTRY